MTFLGRLRSRQNTWTPRVLVLFAMAWLGAVLQPCAMALGSEGDHDCPHCPPAHEMSMHMHGDMESAPCAGGASGCDNAGEYYYDGRHNEPKLKDQPSDQPLVVLPWADQALVPHRTSAPHLSGRSLPPGVPPPLNVLFCVYLN